MPKTARLPIEPELYRATMQKVQLREVVLRALQVSCQNAVAGEVNIDISSAATPTREQGTLHIDTEYKLQARNQTSPLFEIEVTFRVVLVVPDELPDGFVEAYLAHNLSLTVFPYVREIVSSITSRMGLPPLTLPYVVNPFASGEKKQTKTRSRKSKTPSRA